MPYYIFDRYGYCVGGPYPTWHEAVSALARYENLAEPNYDRLSGTVEEYDNSFDIQEHNARNREKFQKL